MANDSKTGLLHHVELYASDFGASEAFWEWLLTELGYTVYQDWDGGTSWKRGETDIVLVQADEEFRDEPYHRRRPGLNHLAFHAESRDHVLRGPGANQGRTRRAGMKSSATAL